MFGVACHTSMFLASHAAAAGMDGKLSSGNGSGIQRTTDSTIPWEDQLY